MVSQQVELLFTASNLISDYTLSEVYCMCMLPRVHMGFLYGFPVSFDLLKMPVL